MQDLLKLGRSLLPASLRYELRHAARDLELQLDRAQIWKWERALLVPQGASRFRVQYIGRREQRWQVASLLGSREEALPIPPRVGGLDGYTALASEAPLPRALRVPFHIDGAVELGRPVDEILAGYRQELRRQVKKFARRAYARQVVDTTEIERVQREMLEPFGTAFHGVHTVNMSLEDVRRIAQETGRLDITYLDGEEVGCHLGYVVTHRGKRYWEGVRVGYPEAVFSDPRRLRVANLVNTHLSLCWAVDNGFDFYNMGMTPARPDDGLLQFKRRRSARLIADFADAFFWLRLPAREQAQFLWDAPLFSVERGRLILHLGLPAGPDDDEVMARYREMSFEGLARVELHSARAPGSGLVASIADLYSRHSERPELVEVPG